MKVHFSWCTRQDTIDIVEMFYESKVPKEDAQHLIENKFTAAEVYVGGIEIEVEGGRMESEDRGGGRKLKTRG